ncbi:serine-rich adhesin for platelets-like isoform X1 [Bufo bufo]|uniref:serine-rich adhesin for platelets-like isoform X1 n=1 Tax=Bufo bufo TaxID=8384 RepID=UPI001ABDA5F5|nr:serine-rich adhesin for platelets-like isoform X1 [Bufo bufo]
MLATSFGIIFLISMALCVFAEDCLVKISGEHQILKNMISTQGYFCSIYVRILKKEQVSDYCDLLALVYEVDGLLETLKFIDGTDNYKSKNSLLRTVSPCIEGLDYTTQNAVNGYLQAENMNPIEILQRVNNSLHKLDGFQADSESSSKCESYYKEQQPSNNGTKGPQCACSCSSPTTPISSSATSQTTLSHSSKLASSTYTTTYSVHTSPLAEEMSGSYPEKNSQGLDSSPSIFTDMPSDLHPLTTTVDHLHAGTTVQPGAFTDFPLTNSDFPVHSTEFKKGTHDPSYVSLNPSQTRTDPEKVKDVSDSDTESMYKSLETATIENSSVTTHPLINGELSTVVEADGTQATTISELSSQSSKGSVFKNSLSAPSKEPVIETSSNSVTKIRRSLVNMDEISSLSTSVNEPNLPSLTSVGTNIPSTLDAFSRATVMTKAVSSLSPSDNDPNLPSVKSVHTNILTSGMGLSNTESPETVSQRKVIGNGDLGWASSYLSSPMLTTKAELSVSSPATGDQLLLSDVTHNPLLNAHKSYNIPPHEDRGIAIDDWKNTVSGPNHGSNLLPFIATERSEDEGKKEPRQSNQQLITNVVLVVLVLLFLSGFLYYMHLYRVLKRRLAVSHDLHLPRNLSTVSSEEMMRLSTTECSNV